MKLWFFHAERRDLKFGCQSILLEIIWNSEAQSNLTKMKATSILFFITSAQSFEIFEIFSDLNISINTRYSGELLYRQSERFLKLEDKVKLMVEPIIGSFVNAKIIKFAEEYLMDIWDYKSILNLTFINPILIFMKVEYKPEARIITCSRKFHVSENGCCFRQKSKQFWMFGRKTTTHFSKASNSISYENRGWKAIINVITLIYNWYIRNIKF